MKSQKPRIFAVEEDKGTDDTYCGILLPGNGHPETSLLASSRRGIIAAYQGRILVYHRVAIHVCGILSILLYREQAKGTLMDTHYAILYPVAVCLRDVLPA